MIDLICSNTEHLNLVLFLGYMVVEYYCGKTKSFEANSILEVALKIFKRGK